MVPAWLRGSWVWEAFGYGPWVLGISGQRVGGYDICFGADGTQLPSGHGNDSGEQKWLSCRLSRQEVLWRLGLEVGFTGVRRTRHEAKAEA